MSARILTRVAKASPVFFPAAIAVDNGLSRSTQVPPSLWMAIVTELLTASPAFSCTGTKQNTAEQAEKSYSVKIQLTQTSSYCGGAQPPAELLKELDNPRPVADKVVYVRSGEKNNQHEIVLEHSTKGNVGFPFPFTAQIAYLFGGDFLSIKTSITNIGTRVIPFGFGWHPYFTLNNKIDENKLKLPRVSQLLVDDRLIPTGGMFENLDWEQPRSIASTIFDTGFKLLSKDKQIVLLNPEKNFGIEVDLLNGYEYVQMFTPPDRKSIAVEPMTCAANAFNNGLGLRTINPKDSFSAEFRISTFWSNTKK